MQKFSSFGRKKKKQTKIRHRMDMLEDLQFYNSTATPLGMNCFVRATVTYTGYVWAPN